MTFAAGENPTDFGSRPTRTVTWVLDDGGGSNNLSTAVTTTVSITNVNDPPTLSNVATNAAFTEEGAAVTLSSAVTVSDPDNLTLAHATISIAGGTFAGDGDVLSTNTTGTNISASYNSSTETLTLTGSDSFTHYQQVLDAVTFAAGENPTDFGSRPTRTLTWVLDDGGGSNNLSTAVTTTVSITNVNDPPTLSNVATNAAFTEEGAAVTLSSAVTVSDPDNLTLAHATISIAGGTFAGDGDVLSTNTTGTNISASYNSSTETLTLTGSDSFTHYQQVLDAVTFAAGENPTDFGSRPTRTLTWVLDDGGGSNNLSTAVTTTVSITNVNDPPTLSGVTPSVSLYAHTAVTLSPSVTVTDPDNLTLASATIAVTGGTFTNDGDLLAATTAGTLISASYNSSTETLTLSGVDSFAHYQQVLDSVTFDAAGPDPTSGGTDPTRTIGWVVNDGGASNNLSTPLSTTVTIVGTAVNSGQTLVVSAGQTSNSILVNSGADLLVLSGGTANNVIVASGGSEAINAGGTASGTTVSSGGTQYDAGTASGTTLSGGTQVVFGSAANTTISNGGTQDVESGGTESGTTVSSGGVQNDAGTASSTTLSGGTQQVFGSAAGTTVSSGGAQNVVSGGTASGTTVSSGGVQNDAGTASNTTLSGGTQVVFGSAAGTTIDSGGTQDVISGGTASGTTVSSGGVQNDAGTASNTTLSGSGTQVVFGSAAGTTIDNGGTQDVMSGGTASGTTVSSGGIQYDAGTASNTTLSGGNQVVFGNATNTMVDSGGIQVVFGNAAGAAISSGGTQDVMSGGTAGGTTVAGGGIQYDAGTASGTTLSGGSQIVFASAASTTIDSGGTQAVASGATASGTTVSSGGIQYDAGTASATTLAGGTAEVFSGGTINGATISSGLLELQSGATGSGTIDFAGGGTLKLDASGAYGFLVAGFAVPDQFDLSDVNFATAQKSYSGNTSSGTLTVNDGTHSVSLLLLGNYTAASFKLGAESGLANGTIVTEQPPVVLGPHP